MDAGVGIAVLMLYGQVLEMRPGERAPFACRPHYLVQEKDRRKRKLAIMRNRDSVYILVVSTDYMIASTPSPLMLLQRIRNVVFLHPNRKGQMDDTM